MPQATPCSSATHGRPTRRRTAPPSSKSAHQQEVPSLVPQPLPSSCPCKAPHSEFPVSPHLAHSSYPTSQHPLSYTCRTRFPDHTAVKSQSCCSDRSVITGSCFSDRSNLVPALHRRHARLHGRHHVSAQRVEQLCPASLQVLQQLGTGVWAGVWVSGCTGGGQQT